VEMSSIGAEILCLIVPGGKEYFVVKLLFGISGRLSEACLVRRVVKARDRDISKIVGKIDTVSGIREFGIFFLPTNEVAGDLTRRGGVGDYPNVV